MIDEKITESSKIKYTSVFLKQFYPRLVANKRQRK